MRLQRIRADADMLEPRHVGVEVHAHVGERLVGRRELADRMHELARSLARLGAQELAVASRRAVAGGERGQSEGEDPSLEVYCDARYSHDPSRFGAVFCVELGPKGATRVLQRRPDDTQAVRREMIAMLRAPADE